MKQILVLFIVLFGFCPIYGKEYREHVRPTKNLILMIPDGTSLGVLSAARWYLTYTKQASRLAIDPYLCGTVQTFSSNAPIGDSAPTTSCYMTGYPSQTGFVSTYPPTDSINDLVVLEKGKAYQPLATLLEAAKIEQKKAVGLVVTVEFPHATPADCAAHYYDRNNYPFLASQMAYQNLDVLFGGGTSLLTEDIRTHLKKENTLILENEVDAFRTSEDNSKIWALFGTKEHPYDLDRNPENFPSLSEMTEKAIAHLSKNEKGFFLMVEGSKIDWSAHGNDAVGCITEYLAFDRAVAKAIDFAKRDGETTVVIVSDHGNSGFSIGNEKSTEGYDKKTLEELFSAVSKYKKTGEGLAILLGDSSADEMKTFFKSYTNIDLTAEELTYLQSLKKGIADRYTEVLNSETLESAIIQILNSRTYFGFTTGGHTGEDVLLAVYHPQNDLPLGMNTNVELHHYLYDVMGLQQPMDKLTSTLFAKHTDVFEGVQWEIDATQEFPLLRAKEGSNLLEIPAFKSVVFLNGKELNIGSVTVYIDKNKTFYLPRKLRDILQIGEDKE